LPARHVTDHQMRLFIKYRSTDTTPVAAAKAGDAAAFTALVEATQADVYTLAYRLMGNEDDARDVAQEAYLRAFRSLKRFRGDARFSTWMLSLIHI